MSIKPHRVHTAVVWDFAGNGMTGDPEVSSPREIKCRWSPVNISDNTTPEQSQSNFAVTVLVNEPIVSGSILYKGCLEDVVGTGTGLEPGQPGPLYIVENYTETPDIKGRFPTRQLNLKRFSNTLPVVV